MKTKKILLIILSALLIIGCYAQAEHSSVSPQKIDTPQDSVEMGWPKDIDGLIAHLNRWNKEELDTYECPAGNPNRITSGETNGWIREHKKRLEKLGATVVWNKELLQYELKKD